MTEPKKSIADALNVGAYDESTAANLDRAAGYVPVAYDPVFKLSADKQRYVAVNSETPTPLPAPGLPFSLVFRAEVGKEDVILKAASAYQNASKRRVTPPAFPPQTSRSCLTIKRRR